MAAQTADLDISESALMDMNVDELNTYLGRVSSIVEIEDSTIKGLEKERLNYDTLIGNSQSTLDGLDSAIFTTTLNLGTVNNDLSSLLLRQSDLSGAILSTVKRIAQEDSTITGAAQRIVDLGIEADTLRRYIDQAESSFKASTLVYSSLYDIYLSSFAAWAKATSTISTLQSQKQSTITAEPGLGNKRDTTKTTYDQTKSTFDSYTAIDADLNRQLVAATAAEKAAQDLLTSSINGLASLSSLYETALLNKRYAEANSTLTQKITDYSFAKTAYDQAILAARDNPLNAGSQTTLTNAKSLLELTSTSQTYWAIEVSTLATLVNKSSDNTYALNLSTIEAEIKRQGELISTYTGQKLSSYAARVKFSTIYESSLSSLSGWKEISSTKTAQNVSSIAGLSVLYNTRNNLITKSTIQYQSLMTMINEIKNYSSLLNEYLSSFQGYSNLSSIYYRGQYISTANAYSTFSTLYWSTFATVSTLEGQIAALTSTISGLNLEITAASSIERKAEIRARQYDYEVMLNQLSIDRGALEYEETFIRQKRLQTQERYEDLVSAEIQAKSTLADAATGPDQAAQIMASVNLNTPDIQTQLQIFSQINAHLDKYQQVYTLYTQQQSQLSTAILGTDTEYTYQVSADTAMTWATLYPSNTSYQNQYQSAQAQLQTKHDEVLSTMGSVMNRQPSIQSLMDTITTVNKQIMGSEYDGMMYEVNSTISSAVMEAEAAVAQMNIPSTI